MIHEPQHLLGQYDDLPEPYQPAWGLDATRDMARRACDDRLAAILPIIRGLPSDAPLRILDIGCAQGYFSLGLKHLLTQSGRQVEVVGIDYLIDNIKFCRDIADFHGLDINFIHDQFDGDFFHRHKLGRFDVVLALNVLHHIRALNGDAAADAALDAIQSNSRALICEIAQAKEALDWVGSSWHSSDDELLKGYSFRRKVGEFSTHLTDVDRPLYVCSQSLVWLADGWYPFHRVTERSHSEVPEAFWGQRSFFFGEGYIIKCYKGSGEYGQFNRDELSAEEAVLNALVGNPERYPQVLKSEDDGEFLWMVRQALPGRSLLEKINEGDDFNTNRVVDGILEELALLEDKGFHHDDIRCWNILYDEQNVRFIDFGSMRDRPSPLHRVALAAVLLEMARRKIDGVESFYNSLHPLDAYPEHWRLLIHFLVSASSADFDYAKALKIFRGLPETRRLVGQEDFYPSAEVLTAVSVEASKTFLRLTQHAENLSRELSKVTEDANAERVAVKKRLHDAQTYAQSLSHELESTRARAQTSERYSQSLAEALKEAQRYSETLSKQLEALKANETLVREEARPLLAQDDNPEALLRELQVMRERAEISERYSLSLVEALKEAHRSTEGLSAELEKVTLDAEAERESARRALQEAPIYAESLLRELASTRDRADESDRRGLSLAVELDNAHRRVEELAQELEKVVRDAESERQVASKALADAPLYAESLLRELEAVRTRATISERYSASLEDALQEARGYTQSLTAEIEKITGDAQAERVGVSKMLADAHAYAQSLLEQSRSLQERVDTLDRQNCALKEELDAVRSSLELQNKQLSDEIKDKEAKLSVLKHKMETALVAMERSEADLHAFRHRFQLFKLFWPRNPRD